MFMGGRYKGGRRTGSIWPGAGGVVRLDIESIWLGARGTWLDVESIWPGAGGVWLDIESIWPGAGGIWLDIESIWPGAGGVWLDIESIWPGARGIWLDIESIWLGARGIWLDIESIQLGARSTRSSARFRSAALRAGWNALDCHGPAALAMTKGGRYGEERGDAD
jgi:hypothetical protein